MWLKAHLCLEDSGNYEVPESLKAVLVLADAVHVDFKDLDEDPGILTAKELKTRVDYELRGGTVEALSLSPGKYSFRKGLWRWIKTDKLWSGMFLFAGVYLAIFWYPGAPIVLYLFFWVFMGLFTSMFLGMMAGWGRTTRLAMSFGGSIIALGVTLRIYTGV